MQGAATRHAVILRLPSPLRHAGRSDIERESEMRGSKFMGNRQPRRNLNGSRNYKSIVNNF
jgi:hypothetical protein